MSSKLLERGEELHAALVSYIATMAPHVRARRQAKLLVESSVVLRELLDTFERPATTSETRTTHQQTKEK